MSLISRGGGFLRSDLERMDTDCLIRRQIIIMSLYSEKLSETV